VTGAEETASWNSWFGKGFGAYLKAAVDDEDSPLFNLVQRVVAEFEATNERIDKRRAEIVELEECFKSTTGQLPQVRDWAPDTVFYCGYGGGPSQARKDCARRPGVGDDWTQVASPGRDGRDGKELHVRGLYSPTKSYAKLDVILYGCEPLMAKSDNPGAPPGGAWMRLAPRGKRGERGAAGPRGPRGAAGAEGSLTISRWHIDPERYCAVPILSNGTVGAPLQLRGLFEQFLVDARSAQ
jgi:hypothetical protein